MPETSPDRLRSEAPLAQTGTLLLRVLAILGCLWRFVTGTYMPGGARPSSEHFYFFVAVILGLSVLLVLAHTGWVWLREHLDLFVPFGCYMFASQLLELAPWSAASIEFGNPGMFFAAGVFAVLLTIATLVLAGIYLSWQTLLILRSLALNDSRPDAALAATWPVLWRGMLGGLVGILGFIIPPLLLLSLASQTGIFFALFMMTLWAVPWSFLTVTWIPILLTTKTPFFPTLVHASRIAWNMKGRWALLLWAWLFALGLLVYFQYSTHTETLTSSNTQNHYTWKLNNKWLGGFENKCSWYTDLVSSAKVLTNSAMQIPLDLLYIAIAIAIKILIFAHLLRANVIQPKDVMSGPRVAGKRDVVPGKLLELRLPISR